MTPYKDQYDLLEFENSFSEVEEKDFFEIGFEKNHKSGETYYIYNLTRGNENIVMLRMQSPQKSGASWIYKKDNVIKGFIHTKEDLKEITP